jgi:phage terminase small subunit
MKTTRGSGDPSLPDGRKRRSLIALGEVDQTFDDAAIMELAKIACLPANADLSRFAKSIRNDVRLFIGAKARLNNPQLRAEIKRIYTLNNRALRGDREAQQLARAVGLATDSEIRERVQQITAVGAERAAVTVESLINEAEQARQGAMEAGQYAAAIAAIKEKGVLSGQRVERRESGSPGEFAELENMTADELRAFLREKDETVSDGSVH